ncbi:hypothetical protein [Nonomuraea recticatena]|uniref:hypothetical protein n=1 Tax=Nonomuraea recticatena TaxID=46178 RepID=UPI003621B49C
MLRLFQAMRNARTKDLTRHLAATPLEHIYARFGRDILAQAAQDRALSDAIAKEVAEIDRSIEEEGVDPTPSSCAPSSWGTARASSTPR